jgi:hypothetical protein
LDQRSPWDRRGLLSIVQGRAPGAPSPANDVAALKDDRRASACETHSEFQVRRAARSRALGGVKGREIEGGPHGANLTPRIAVRPHGFKARAVVALRPTLDESALLLGERARAHDAAMEEDARGIEFRRRSERNRIRSGPVAKIVDRKLLSRARRSLGLPLAALWTRRDLRLRRRVCAWAANRSGTGRRLRRRKGQRWLCRTLRSGCRLGFRRSRGDRRTCRRDIARRGGFTRRCGLTRPVGFPQWGGLAWLSRLHIWPRRRFNRPNCFSLWRRGRLGWEDDGSLAGRSRRRLGRRFNARRRVHPRLGQRRRGRSQSQERSGD